MIIFLPLKESLADMDFFAILSLGSSHLELLRIELPKSTSSILMEIVTIPVAWLVNSIFICTSP